MKRIMCYGDSITWGFTSQPCLLGKMPERLDENIRWTSRLQKSLGSDYRVFEAGLPGRTIAFDDASMAGRNGFKSLEVTFESCNPLDLVVIMLGTNDVRTQFSDDPELVGRAMSRLITFQKELIARSFNPACKILVVAPPKALPGRHSIPVYTQEWCDSIKALGPIYEGVCKMQNVYFACAYDWCDPDPLDGIHLDEKGNADFAIQIEKIIRDIID